MVLWTLNEQHVFRTTKDNTCQIFLCIVWFFFCFSTFFKWSKWHFCCYICVLLFRALCYFTFVSIHFAMTMFPIFLPLNFVSVCFIFHHFIPLQIFLSNTLVVADVSVFCSTLHFWYSYNVLFGYAVTRRTRNCWHIHSHTHTHAFTLYLSFVTLFYCTCNILFGVLWWFGFAILPSLSGFPFGVVRVNECAWHW